MFFTYSVDSHSRQYESELYRVKEAGSKTGRAGYKYSKLSWGVRPEGEMQQSGKGSDLGNNLF